MVTTFTACVLTAPETLAPEQRELQPLLDRLPPSGVLVRIRAAGVCHSDVHFWHGYFDLGRSEKAIFAERGRGYPKVPGHEIAGSIHALGSSVEAESGLKVDQRVVAYPWIGCGECPTCKAGDTHLCSKSEELGFAADGGFAEFVLVPHYRYIFSIPDNLPYEYAALLPCGALTAYTAIKKSLPVLEKTTSKQMHPIIAVIGLGGLGQWALKFIPQCIGVSHTVIGVDISEEKLKLVQESGLVSNVFHFSNARSAEEQAQEFLSTFSKGTKPNAILDFVNSTATFTFALRSLQRSGCLVAVGLHGGRGELKLPLFALSDCTIVGNCTGSLKDTAELIALVSKNGITPPPISHYPLQDAEKALQDLNDGHILGRAVLKMKIA